MFQKKTISKQIEAPGTIIGKNVVLEAARLGGSDSVRIDGEYKGAIDISGSLILGETGSVTGDIAANLIVVAGSVNGNIQCESMLHFASTARVVGDIKTAALTVDEGSQISGHYYVGSLNAGAKTETFDGEKRAPREPNDLYYGDSDPPPKA